MQDRIKYWKGIEELENTPEFAKHAHNEFPEFLPINEAKGESPSSTVTAPRRDFLKLLGFGLAAATLASCEAPVRKAIPYLNKPVDVEPGVANWYASTYFSHGDYNSILVKTREGRPIKIEPNPTSSVTPLGTSPRAQASVLNLYDNNRLRAPFIKGKESDWAKLDREVMSKLSSVNGKVVLVSSTVISPSTKQLIDEFGVKTGNFEHVVYDANSVSALLGANGGVIPGYDFSKANIIVSIGADFLGSWIAPTPFSKQYIQNRKVSADKKDMSRHYQFETILSLTGANADVRVPIKPSQELALVQALSNSLGGGGSAPAGIDSKAFAAAVKDLNANRGKALVVSGSNDPAVQTLVASINRTLGAEGTTIDTAAPYFVKQGNDAQMLRFIDEMNAGSIGAVFFYKANPAYDHPLADKVVSGLKKVGLTVSFAEIMDETASLVEYVAPDNNYLESWNDFEPKKGFLSIAQPAISPIFTTRQMQDSLLTWNGSSDTFYDYIRNNWRKVATGDFNTFWEKSVHDGVLESGATMLRLNPAAATAAAATTSARPAASGIEAVVYEKIQMGPGYDANNPWLQEMGDPITKATWGNYITISRSDAEAGSIVQGDVLRLTTTGGKTIEAPALIQPGQAVGTVGIAMGYGRTLDTMPVAKGLGANAFPVATVANNSVFFNGPVKQLEKTGATSEIAQMQTHHTIMDRLVVQENTLAKYVENPKEVTEYIRLTTHAGKVKPSTISLWDDYEYKNHHWGMVVDLNSCIGCGACTLSCHIENNVPVVGKAEVLNRREMHWMRIDRYYSAREHKEGEYDVMEHPADNPTVIFQPMMCQHCNHAPCETVCPVAATMHSSEGINQMAYNRCVGTRYCANNCPYKVRRFNWFAYANNDKFDYNMNNDLGKMVLNPDVVVRARGVMEKCSFCVQRVQLGKLEAKRENRRPKDGEIVSACAQSCPTDAIIFGDMLDPESRISKVLAREQGERAFHVLEEINTQPNVTYLTKIRNLA
ncbi:TAT-variant-translocated molybdopterin oxidoreductase [Botryobacter ruber]|uniref:TAT-variant-translocated molybdopterin oxidoreductase n=1 Tax=Botryobacter ruber TaxID=2171629 RepID=UPI000E0A364D|nr:TAT-variant-translocated molybdopterin oxidoreductase [Botryobacter ruber]